MAREVAVKVENLTKTFRIPTEASSGIKQKLINTLKGKKGYREFTPLKDISFEIEKGDFFGIVGRNGSGKSTLLKSIANIYTPTKGQVHVNGTLVPFIELGVGFNPELTGRENVFLNGALLGFSHDEMEAMYDEIVDFAEIGEFMEEKLKNYSSGMQVRLAFSIAIKAEGDILLLDEVLAVGDEAFQRKCYEYFEDLKKNNRTVILVSHDMASVRRFCNKALLIDKGSQVMIGNPGVVSDKYSELNMPPKAVDRLSISRQLMKDNGVSIVATNDRGEGDFVIGENLNLDIKWSDDTSVQAVWADIYRNNGVHVCNFVTSRDGYTIKEGQTSCKLTFNLRLAPGDYYIDIAFWDSDLKTKYLEFYPALNFRIQNDWSKSKVRFGGLVNLESTWK